MRLLVFKSCPALYVRAGNLKLGLWAGEKPLTPFSSSRDVPVPPVESCPPKYIRFQLFAAEMSTQPTPRAHARERKPHIRKGNFIRSRLRLRSSGGGQGLCGDGHSCPSRRAQLPSCRQVQPPLERSRASLGERARVPVTTRAS